MTVIFLFVLLAALGGGGVLYTPDKPRPALEAEYAQPPSIFVDVAGVRLHVRDTGPRDAPALILLHGFGSSLHTWEDWAHLLEADHRVIRFDLPGFGLTGPDPTGDYSDERCIDVMIALMDKLGVARATIVGNSMGGRIAWMFAAAHPERTGKLVLISPDGFASFGRVYGEKPEVPMMMRLLPYTLPTWMLRQTLQPSYGDPSHITAALVERYHDMLLVPGVREAIVARSGQQILPDPATILPHIETPTLLLWGEKDAMIPFSSAQDYLRLLPHARLAAFPAYGHVLQEEAPGPSVEALRSFLAE